MGLFSKLFGKKEAEPVKQEAPSAPKAEEKKVETPVKAAKPEVKEKTEIQTKKEENTMSEKIKFTIDGKECFATEGQTIIDAAADNGVYIPSLCHVRDVNPAGSCRICTVKVNGRNMTACTTPIAAGMEVVVDNPELNDMRSAIVEVLFAEGNHFCPACEKSGSCELQALGYKFQMMVPRFPYSFPKREVDASASNIYLDKNRCIMCKRCIRTVQVDGKNVFAFKNRGVHLEINMDSELASKLSETEAQKAMDNCPVGAILKKGRGYIDPIGTRKYDKTPIGTEIESKN